RDRPTGPGQPAADEIPVPIPMGVGRRLAPASHLVRGLPRESDLTIQVMDRRGQGLSEERDIGPFPAGVREASIPFTAAADVEVSVTALDWSEEAGPRVAVNGDVVVSGGIKMRIGVRPTPVGPTERKPFAAEVSLVNPGVSWHEPERSFEPGVPSHPWVALRFAGREVGGEWEIGQCV